MLSLDDLIREAEVAHGHLCAGQVLGVRMAMLGLTKLGMDDPRGKDRKRLITFVEIDRCATDAIGVVTGCRLGKRALKFRDWGKMAATFIDLETSEGAPLKPSFGSSGFASGRWHRAVRIAAKESSKTLAREMHPEIENKNQQQMLAYREMTDDDLFSIEWVKVELPAEEFPGYKGDRIVCAECGEGINFHRQVERNGRVLCRACSGERYYQAL
jgi:formylmethanofuran dehydrogenase subunit E